MAPESDYQKIAGALEEAVQEEQVYKVQVAEAQTKLD